MQPKTIRLLQDILRDNMTDRPDKIALICEKTRLTYAQIDAMSNRLANAFRDNGIQDGDRILFYLLNSSELVVSIFAVLKANAVFSVIDYANTFDTLSAISANCEAAALITHDHQSALAAHLMQDLPSMKIVVLTGKTVKQSLPKMLAFDQIQENYPLDPLPQRTIDRDIAFLVYTSGSTGQSKGVVVTHRSALSTIENGVEYFGLCEKDIHTSPLPMSSSPGINQIFQTFRVGATLILEKSFAFPVVTLKRMTAEGATGFAGVPTLLALLLQMDLSCYDLSRLRYITCVGAVLAPNLIQQLREKLPQTSLYSFYGLAEASYSLGLEPDQIDLRPTSVGKPFPGTQAWIVDENGHRLRANEVGELVIRGSHVRSGYWSDPETSANRFRPGPLPGELVCYTGDMFRTDEAGYYYFVGRIDDIIKSGAKKIAPMEIENALYGYAGVLEAAVIGIPDPILGQVIKAFVVPNSQAQVSLTAENILMYCHQKLEAYKVPRFVEIRDQLPKTPSGKIKKIDLV